MVAFLQLLLTPQELNALRHRWQAFQLSLAGHSQREIRDTLGVSIATATRAARVVRESPEIVEMILRQGKLSDNC
jgi:Trp operon repressor